VTDFSVAAAMLTAPTDERLTLSAPQTQEVLLASAYERPLFGRV
jgi:hypothetical protein